MDKEQLLQLWDEGWDCLFSALDSLDDGQLEDEMFIRNMGHTIREAINRQLAHYPYHIGQIVFICKMISDSNWASLSIPKGNSKKYNSEKFSKPKRSKHFTDDL